MFTSCVRPFMRSASPASRLAWVVLPILLASLAAALPAGPGLAQVQPDVQPDAQPDTAAKARRLDELFARLKSTQHEDEGDALVAGIWGEWVRSGTPDLDEKMEQAAALMGQGLHPLALSALTELVERAPGWAEAWN